MIHTISTGWNTVKHILDQHTDTISSIGILAVTTGMLAAKIFQGIPAIIGRSGRVFLEFSGVIWLNVQIKEFLKVQRDFIRSLGSGEMESIARTALKVTIAAMNIFFTCAYFAASLVTFAGFSHISMSIYLALRPFSLGVLSAELVKEVWDYSTNLKILNLFSEIESQRNAGQQLAKIMRSYLKIISEDTISRAGISEVNSFEGRLASNMVSQLDSFSIKLFSSNLGEGNPRIKALRLYYDIKYGIGNIQDRVKSNLSLSGLGYVSRCVCKMYPDSLIEMMTRWTMSVLFTDELVIKYKIRQIDAVYRS